MGQSGMRGADAGLRLRQGKTHRAELAVRAYRIVSAHDDRGVSRTPRRFELERRLEAVLSVLTPAELAFYHHEVAGLAVGRR